MRPADDREFAFGNQQQRLPVCHYRLRAPCSFSGWPTMAVTLNGFSPSLRSSTVEAEGRILLVVCNIGTCGPWGITRAKYRDPTAGPDLGVGENSDKCGKSADRYGSSFTGQSQRAGAMNGFSCETSTEVAHEESSQDAVRDDILRALRASLPNDLSRLIFLAILRDNNSGHYYHPEVAQRFSVEVADRAMLACHHEIYERVVVLPLEDLTDQLDAYMATVPAPKERLIESWTKLRAYRATIPMDADPISTEIFFMKVEVAVAILEARLPGRVQ